MVAVDLDWYACDLRTGVVVEELLSLSLSGPIERRLAAATTAQADLDAAGAPPEWPYATQPGRSLLVAADRATHGLLWAGIILTRERGSADAVSLGLATPEAYLDRRFTGSYDAGAGADQAAIMTGVAGALLTDAPPFLVDAPAIGVQGTYSVLDADDRTVLSALQELQQQDGWPEWTVDVQWTDAARTAVQLVLRVRQQIGIVRTDPEAVFDFPGCVTSYSQTESYEAGKGATDVTAYGTGEGSARLHSDLHTASDLIAAGWARWQYRYTPSAGGDDPSALNAAAAKALASVRTGSSAWAIQAAASAAPRLGADWALGDSLRLHVASSPGHPQGADITARAYAWQLDPGANTLTPILVEDDT